MGPNTAVEEGAFQGCGNLRAVVIEATDVPDSKVFGVLINDADLPKIILGTTAPRKQLSLTHGEENPPRTIFNEVLEPNHRAKIISNNFMREIDLAITGSQQFKHIFYSHYTQEQQDKIKAIVRTLHRIRNDADNPLPGLPPEMTLFILYRLFC